MPLCLCGEKGFAIASAVDISKYIAALEGGVLPRVREVVARAIVQFAEHVLGEAVELCPIDTGNLRDSAFASAPVDEGGVVTVTIGFNMFYAAYVHEILTAHHPHGQAKFLETAMQQNAVKFHGFILEQLKAEFG